MATNSFTLDLQQIWLKGAYVITGVYLLFAFALIGVPGLSQFAAPICFVLVAWIAWGVIAGFVTLPKVLLFPALFYGFLVLVTAFDRVFPYIYLGKIFTIWVGAMALAVLVANGVKLRHVFDAFMVILLLNLIAIWVGYDGQQRNVLEELNMQEVDLPRYSGLAGQQNTLSTMALFPMFLLLLRGQLISFPKFLILTIAGLLITYYTGSRNALVLTAAFSVLGAVFLLYGNRLRIGVLVLSLPLLIGWTLVVKSNTLRTSVEMSSAGQVTVIKRMIDQSDGVEESAISRENYVKMLWQQFPDAPIFGHGSEYFEKINPHQTYSHNNYVELLVNHGAVGFLIFYLMYARILKAAPGTSLFERLRVASVVTVLLVADTWDVHYMNRVAALVICLALIVVSREIRSSAMD
jgi:O-antigen ligase